ncbi:formin-like protein [Gracilaria domingensis]|nr:formin-like protein [Gracilaria domingensis]
MGVCLAFELLQCAGKHLDSSESSPNAPPQVSNDEASSSQFVPVEGTSAALITPHRLLVTGGMIQNVRVLPFSVIRYLDFDSRSDHAHRWGKPTLLRSNSQRGGAPKRARRSDVPIPVCRVEHTLTLVPENANLYLLGGMKIGGRDGGMACTTMFAFDSKAKTWDSVEPAKPFGRVKEDPNEQLGPRFAHTATYVSYTPKCSSSRQQARAKPAPFIYVYGGFSKVTDHEPVADVHVFDVKKCKWSLAIPASSAVQPRGRAYHAAALTPSGKYIAFHGGILSDPSDNNAMSDELLLFDVEKHKWIKPELHGSSDTPPVARKQHSLVAGVGRHQGSLVMYGGDLMNETFSKEMFLCNVLEPDHKSQRIEVLWEKVDVRTTISSSVPDGANDETKKVLSDQNAALSGGCMVSIPALGKYIIVGGKTAYGMRTAPLMLDPGESDDIAKSQSVQLADEPPRLQQITDRALQVEPKNGNGRHSPFSPRERCDELNGNLYAPMVDEDNQQGIGRSPSPAEGGREIPRASSIQRTSSEKSPAPTAGSRGKMNAGGLGTDRFRKRKLRSSMGPSSKILPTACNAIQPAPNPAEREAAKDPLREADALLRRSQKVNANRPSRPLKKRRLRSDARELEEQKEEEAHGLVSPAPLVDDPILEDHSDGVQDLAAPQSMSTRSEFIAPSEIKRIGRANTAKKNGGRGRVTVRQKQAELDASKKKIEAQELKIRRSTSELTKLRKENHELQEANVKYKGDNLDLNGQMERLLEEVQTLRNHAAEITGQQASDNGVVSNSAPIAVQDESVAKHAASSSNEGNIISARSATRSGRGGLMKARRGGADVLEEEEEEEEETTALCSERESLLRELKQCEEERRRVVSEMNKTRNLLDKSHEECRRLRTKANDCEKAMREAFASGESTQSKLRNAEHDIVTLKSKNESLCRDLGDERHRLGSVTSERKARDQQINKLQGELAEVKRKFGDNDGKHRLLLGDLENERAKLEELNKTVNAHAEKTRKMEEQYAEVASERDTLRAELEDKVREHAAALAAGEKERAALDALRKQLCDGSIERARATRELDARARECGALRAQLARVMASCKSIWPALATISRQFERVVRESDAAERAGGAAPREAGGGQAAAAAAAAAAAGEGPDAVAAGGGAPEAADGSWHDGRAGADVSKQGEEEEQP